MSHLPPPPIDRRSYADFVARTEALLQRYAGWSPPEGDPAAALVRVFARMAERVSDRLNRVPDRNFLAFLDLIGVDLRPPQPARAPLTFSLAAGAAVDAVVPARTQVAGQPLEGEKEPVVFETERELVVTRTVLSAVMVRDPGRDRWADRTARAAAGTPFPAFAGETPMTHRLHLSHPAALGAEAPKTVRLRLASAPPAAPWPRMVEWSWRDAAGEHALAPAVVSDGPPWEVAFTGLPAVPETEVAGVRGAWLSARLLPPLLLRDELPDAVLAGGTWAEPGETLFPFGRLQPSGPLAVSGRTVFTLPGEDDAPVAGAVATLRVELDDRFAVPLPDDALQVQWEYSVARGGWAPLGLSAPGDDSVGAPGPLAFSDGTRALTRSGTVTFRVPDGWAPGVTEGRAGMWLRARVVAGGYTGGTEFRPPAVRRLALGYDLPVPPLTGVQARVELSGTDLLPAAGFFNALGLDLTRDFFPFGERPRLGDAFYLALPQLRGKAGAQVGLRLTVNPAPVGAPAAGPQPTLLWEFWSAATRRWQAFGESTAGTPSVSGYGFTDHTASLTTRPANGPDVVFTAPALGEVEVNGRSDAWIRVRIAAGDYGQDARYASDTVRDTSGNTTVYRLVPATYRPPSVHSVGLEYSYTSPWTAPDAVVPENDWAFAPLVPSGGAPAPFSPFTASVEPRPSLYLGFQRPGDAAGFANRTTTLYFGLGEVLFGAAADARGSDEPAVLAWWYWSGTRWARLGVRDETAAFTRRGVVTFLGPPDFRASTQFGREAFWLRVTLERGGWRHPPRLERVLLNTVWAEHAARVTGEVLGSGNGKPDQRLRTARAPVLPGEHLEVREAELPSPAEREELERET
ncbi:MAG TPA: hypothetical protein VF263_17400, partial [Longimicrobiaceae bacterium]